MGWRRRSRHRCRPTRKDPRGHQAQPGLERDRRPGGGHHPGAGHGRSPEGRQRSPRHGDESGPGGVPALPEGDAAQPRGSALARSRPVRALVRPLEPDPLHPAVSSAAGVSSSRTSSRCAPGTARPRAIRSTATLRASRPPPARWARASATQSGWRWPPGSEHGLLDPETAEGESVFDHHVYAWRTMVTSRRASAPRRPRSQASSSRQPDADLRREPDLHRGRHQRRPGRGRRQSLRGLRLARADRRLDQRRALPTRRTCPRCTRRSGRLKAAPTSRA